MQKKLIRTLVIGIKTFEDILSKSTRINANILVVMCLQINDIDRFINQTIWFEAYRFLKYTPLNKIFVKLIRSINLRAMIEAYKSP